MFFRTLRDLARPQIVALFDVLKRSDGMAVGDIAKALKMSYMGVKQYCVELEKRGYLDTWRRPRETGRPELTYRLTAKAQALFPQHSNELSLEILEAVRQLHGVHAAEKVLYQYFVKKTEFYLKKIKGKSLIERATSLARLRDGEAHCTQVDYDARHGLRLTEFHSPLADLIKLYPSVAKMEEAMLSRLLQVPVQREVSSVSGLMRITFLIAGATLPPPAAPTAGPRERVAPRKGRQENPPAAVETDAGSLAELLHTAVTTAAPDGVDAAPAEVPAMEPAVAGPVSDEPVSAETVHEAGLPEAAAPEDQSAASLTPEAAPTAPLSAVAAPGPPATADDGLLFDAPATPRVPVRALAPVRPAAKKKDPEAEELFLSL